MSKRSEVLLLENKKTTFLLQRWDYVFIMLHCFGLDGGNDADMLLFVQLFPHFQTRASLLRGANVVSGCSACCTHHSSQAVLFHQLQRVLVARCEVVVLGRADVISGHGAHGVDDICEHTWTPRQLCAASFDHGWYTHTHRMSVLVDESELCRNN